MGLELAQWLASHAGALAIRSRLEVGTYRSVPLFRGPSPWPPHVVIVMSLPNWLRLEVGKPTGGAALHQRFLAEVRPPTPAEMEAMRVGEPPRSQAGFPFEGEDLEAALANQWKLDVKELIIIETSDPEAMHCFQYYADSRSDSSRQNVQTNGY